MRTQHRYTFRSKDGATICLDPGRAEQPVILYYGRENMAADDSFAVAVLAALQDLGWRIAQFNPADSVMGLALDPNRQLAHCPLWRGRALKLLRLVCKPALWRYYLYRKILGKTRYTRLSALRCIETSGIGPDVVLGYSAGARFGAAIADALKLKGLVCMGYPFKHPRRGDEPARYRPLATLRTPCLILQGQNDEYGGVAEVSRYPLSDAVEMRFLKTDHNFALGETEVREAIDAVLGFLRTQGIDRHG